MLTSPRRGTPSPTPQPGPHLKPQEQIKELSARDISRIAPRSVGAEPVMPPRRLKFSTPNNRIVSLQLGQSTR